MDINRCFDSTFNRAYFTALEITGQTELASAAVKDAYYSSFKNIDRLVNPDSYGVWLNRLVVFYAVKYLEASNGGELNLDYRDRDRIINYLYHIEKMSFGDISKVLNINFNTVKDTVLSRNYQKEYLEETENRIENLNISDVAKAAMLAQVQDALNADQQPQENTQNVKPVIPKDDPEFDPETWDKYLDSNIKSGKRELLIKYAAIIGIFLIISIPMIFRIVRLKVDRSHTTRQYSYLNILENPKDLKLTQLANKLSSQLDGQVGEIYQIDDETYYLVIYLNGDAAESSIVKYSEGDENPTVVTHTDKILSEEEINTVVEDSYLGISYSSDKSKSPHSMLADAISEAGAEDIVLENNNVEVDGSMLSDMAYKAQQEKDKLYSVLGYEDEEMGDMNVVLKIRCRNVDLSKPVRITLDPSVCNMIGNAGNIQIIFNTDKYSVGLNRMQLTELCEIYKTVTVIFTAEDERSFKIEFIDGQGQQIPDTFGDIELTLPADSNLTYVKAKYSNGTENRGGVYDKSFGTICFPVNKSGQYVLIGNLRQINDIEGLDEAKQNALNFMAAMNFISLDENDCILPDTAITRGELIKLIGEMFLSVNDDQESDLNDVSSDDPYYEYVAAGLSTGIIDGYADGTFAESSPVSRSELITMCGNTIIHRRDLKADAADLSLLSDDLKGKAEDYAYKPMAVLLEQEITTADMIKEIGSPVSRAQASELLYRMYCSLYGFALD